MIELHWADENWNADNIALFATFISELSSYELQFSEVNDACSEMHQSDYHRFNKNARLFWSDKRWTLYYEEQLNIDMNS